MLALLSVLALLMVSAPTVYAAPSPCRVRNATQDTHGRSLVRMVEKAEDGDLLRVRGTCPGEVVVDVDIEIAGAGDHPTITGLGRSRVLRVTRGTIASLQGLAVRRGLADFGAGIRNAGRLTLVRVTLRNNSGPTHMGGGTGPGGGVFNRGRLRVTDSLFAGNSPRAIQNAPRGRLALSRSVIRDNTAVGDVGAGILNWGRLRIVDSTVRDNASTMVGGGNGSGGGIYNFGTLAITGSTILGNTAEQGGGGILNRGPASLADSTVTGNATDGIGGGIRNAAGLALTRVTVTGNESSGEGAGVGNAGDLALVHSAITGNTAGTEGGGIWNFPGGPCGRIECPPGTVTLDAASSVTDNTPDDCVGTDAC